MVFVNYTTMQVTTKVVYYGPGLCGKTTNLQWIHRKTAPGSRGEMISLETETDRTLFFDLLPLDVGMVGGMKVRLQLYTVPGQVYYNTTRRMVLKGADAVVFVADSQVPALDANEEALANLWQNMQELAMDPDEIPLVLQYNKRDLGHIVPIDRLDRALNRRCDPAFAAAAIHGVGVFETLKEVSRRALDSVRARLAEDGSRPGVRVRAPAPAPPPHLLTPPPPVDHARLEPLEIEFAQEDTDHKGLKPVPTQDPAHIELQLGRLRETPAATPAPDGDVESLFQTLISSDQEAEQEIERQATVAVPGHVLRDLSCLRLHLSLEHDGAEELLQDAVSITLTRTGSLARLRLQLDLKLERE